MMVYYADHPDTMRAALSEFIATAIFVFAAEGSILALGKMYEDTTTAGGLIAVAIAHALALTVAVAVAINSSGGHVNPAVTLGALAGGRISVVRAVYYWIAQILGAIVESLLLRFTTAGMRPENGGCSFFEWCDSPSAPLPGYSAPRGAPTYEPYSRGAPTYESYLRGAPAYESNSSVSDLQCPCGGGPCLVLTSKTAKNPGRQYYSCPEKEVEQAWGSSIGKQA